MAWTNNNCLPLSFSFPLPSFPQFFLFLSLFPHLFPLNMFEYHCVPGTVMLSTLDLKMKKAQGVQRAV